MFGDDEVISSPLPSLMKTENNKNKNHRKKSPSSLIKL